MVLLKLRGEMTGMKSPGTEEKSQRGKRPLGSRLARTAGPRHKERGQSRLSLGVPKNLGNFNI